VQFRARRWRRWLAAVVAGSMCGGSLVVATAGHAQAADQSIALSWITNNSRTMRVRALTQLGGTLYVGGEFSAVAPARNTPTIAQGYLFAIDAVTGVLRPDFRPILVAPAGTETNPSGVLALEADPATGSLFVGGTFTSVNGQPVTGFAVLDPATGALKPGVEQRSAMRSATQRGSVLALRRAGSTLYVGGAFSLLGGATRSNLARIDLTTFAVDPWRASLNGAVEALAADPSAPGRIYVGGRFTAAGPVNDGRATFLCAFATTAEETLLNWFPSADGGAQPAIVLDLDAAGGRVYAAIAGGGGQFNIYDGTPGASPILVRQMRSDGNIQAVKVYGDVVYAGGHHDAFTSPSLPWGKVAAFRVDTLQPDPSFTARVSGTWGVFAFAGTGPADVWIGGDLVSVRDGALSYNIGNLVHLRPTPVDTQPPTAPGRPTATPGVFTDVRVAWTAASDDRFVSAYEISVNGTARAVASGSSREAVVTGLSANTTYQITVVAMDGARQRSAPSAAAAVTTGSGPPALPNPLRGFGQFYPVNPFRVLDTRAPLGVPSAVPAQGGRPLAVRVAGIGEVPASGVSMVALNVTVTAPTQGGFLTVYPDGEARPGTSNLNFAARQTVPNLVLARVPASGLVDLALSAGAAHVLVDVVGWFGSGNTPAPGAKLAVQSPSRVLDTRPTAPVGPGRTIELQVAAASSGVAGVVLNLTGVAPTATTFVTAYPADEASRPVASNLNLVPGQIRPNLVMVRVPTSGPGAGRIKLFNAAGSTHLVVDVMGAFTRRTSFDNDPNGRLLPLDRPVRLIDTRVTGRPLLGPGSTVYDLRVVDEATPARVGGLVVNATATRATQNTFLTFFPGGQPPPLASNLNVRRGEDVPNAVVAALSSVDGLGISNHAGSVDLVVDVAALVLG
jgi:hypothetical protein